MTTACFNHKHGSPQVHWISCFPEECEILLTNQYLPIYKTINHEKNDQNKIDILLQQLQVYKNKIIKKNDFYRQIGFGINKEKWIPSILKHHLLFAPIKYNNNNKQTVLHRLGDELKIKELTNLLSVFSTTFDEILKPIRPFCYQYLYKAIVNDKYKDFDHDNNFKKYTLTLMNCQTNEMSIIMHNEYFVVHPNIKYKIYIFKDKENEFCVKEIYEPQQLPTYFNDNLKIKNDEMIKFKYNANDINNNFNDNDIFTIQNSKFIVRSIDDIDDNKDEYIECDDVNNFEIKLPKYCNNDTIIRSYQLYVLPINKIFVQNTDSKIVNFEHRSDFDRNGVFYALGTNFGKEKYKNPGENKKVIITTSGMYEGNSYDFIGRKETNTYTQGHNDKASYFCVRFINHGLKPTHYSLRHINNNSLHALRDWMFEGSINAVQWICLKKHINDKSLKKPSSTKTWKLDKTTKYFSYFRIKMNGKNSDGLWNLHCSGFEIYGDLCFGSYSNTETKIRIKTFDHIKPKYSFLSNNNNPLNINKKLKITKYGNNGYLGDDGGIIQIISKSSIIIHKNGEINANLSGPKNIFYNKHDGDELKFGQSVIHCGGGIIELISYDSIINYGTLCVDGFYGGTLSIKCLNNFINEGDISCKNNGNLNIKCSNYKNINIDKINKNNDNKINIKINNVNTNDIKFSNINKSFLLLDKKEICLKVTKHNGYISGYKPENILLSDGSTYCSKKVNVKNDFIIFSMNDIYVVKTVKINNYGCYGAGLNKISLYLSGENENNKWYKLCDDIDNIKQQEGNEDDDNQCFSINCLINIRDIYYKKLKLLKLQIKQNHGNDYFNECQHFGIDGLTIKK